MARFGDIILPWKLRYALALLAKASKGTKQSDQIVSEVMTAWLEQNHPDVVKFVAEREKAEEEMVTLLTPPEQQKKAKSAKVKQAQTEIADDFPAWEKQA